MKKNYFLITLLFSFLILKVNSQAINDNFEDGDLTGWTEGTVGHWANSTTDPITGAQSLKHNLSGVSNESYIYHDISSLNLATQNITWQFNLKNGNWDPSSGNRFWVYLTANETNLNGPTVDGYAVGVNLTGTTDIITLWKVTNGAADGAIVTSTIDWNSNQTYGIRVTRSTSGIWELLIDSDGGFDTLVSQGSNTNADYTFSNNFGLSFDFSSTRAGLLWMDDVLVEGVAPSSDPAINFDSASSSENETDATFNTLIPVTMTNFTSNVTVSVTIDGSSTADAGDYTLNTSSITFMSNGTQNISLDINDDADFLPETVVLNIAVTSGTADIVTSQHTVTINDDDLPIVINEIHADPDATNGDANGDGTVSTSQDEFVEIYNVSGASLDISGWVIADAAGDRHVFPNNTVIPADEAIVVFGGGTPVTVPGLVQTASVGFLGLTNGGDSVIIKNDSGVTIVNETYGSEGGDNQSLARSDDFTGSFVKHSTIATNPVLFSPGRHNTDNTSFASTVKWTGATNNDWATTTNWLTGAVPGTMDDVVIPSGLTNYPTISSAITINSINIDSEASLIANASVTGTVSYTRNLPTTNWYLVSMPIAGETYDNLIANHTFATGTGSNIGIGVFDNLTGPAWNYSTAASSGAMPNQGYSMKFAAAGDLTMTGTINSSNVNNSITPGTRNNFNLVGNPFTSYVNSATFTTANTALLTEETLWLWDGSQYVTYNAATPIEIAPAQGFFIEAGSAGNVTFATSNQSHQGTDTFMRQTPKPSFELFVESGTDKKGTKVFYVEGKTKGFDNGYDSKMFNGVSQEFAVFTQLLSDNDGRNLAIQTLPNTDHETMVIPVGLITETGKEITFSITETNLPNGIEVYLEDRTNNTFVNLSEGNHTITTKSAVNGIGQYYIHTTSARLSTNDLTQDIANVSIYKSAKNEITVAGLQAKANVKVFSLLGEELVNTNINSNGLSKVALPNLATGVYVVKLNSVLGNITKKIILE